MDPESNKTEIVLDKKIVVALPQALYNKNEEELGAFDLIVIDEAHNFYLVDDGMVKSILSRTKHSCELLLTGSPSKFIAENEISNGGEYKIVSISSSELLENKVILDPKIVLLKTNQYKFDLGDYFAKDELKKRRIDIKLTKDVIHEVIKNIYELNTNSKIINFSKSDLNVIKKIMLVALDEQHAFEIKDILNEIGLKTILSTHSFDSNSEEIENFKLNENIQALVVVQRGILGFNYPNLQCVVDISLSLNPDRMFQMISRVVRLSTEKNKLFIKVMPENLIEIAEVALSCACALSVKEVYETYSGNYRGIEVPIFNNNNKFIERDETKEQKEYIPNISYIPSFGLPFKTDHELFNVA